MILDVDPKQKKKKGVEYFELPEEMDETWILEHQAFLVQDMRTKAEKKFAKDNEKLVAEGQKEMKAKDLTERLEPSVELEKKFKKENKSKKIEAEGKGPSIEKFEATIAKIDERIATARLKAEDREGNKEVALGTSKIVSVFQLCGKSSANTTRTTSIPVLLWSSQESSMFLLRNSSLRPSERSSPGPSTPLKTMTSGTSEPLILTCANMTR